MESSKSILNQTSRNLFSILVAMIVFGAYVENAVAQKNTQTVRGTVIDQESRTPLPGASVVMEMQGVQKATAADANGNFVLTGIEVGRYAVRVSFVGYQSTELPEILVSSAKETVLQIALEEQVTKLEDVTVKMRVKKDAPLNPMATVSARSFSVEDTRRYAGSLDDPARMASAFAGVSSGNIQDNAIIVRGNAPRGIVWKLEDVQIPNPTHFADGNVAGGGFVTMFSSQLLTNSDFYTSAFPAEYGNGLSGVFDMKLRNGNNQKREHSFQAGVMGIDFASEGPFAKGKQASYLFNYRYSTFALIKPFIKGMEQLPVYQDLSFKLNFPAGRKGTFSLWGIGGDDKVSEPTTTDSSKWKMDFDRVHTDWRAFTGATGISHRVNTGANTYINSTIASTMYNASYDEDALNNSLTMIDNCDIRIKSNKLVASTYINHKFTSRLMCRTGITGNELYYNLFLRSSNKFAPPMDTIIDNEHGNTTLSQVYTQWKYNITDMIVVNAGMYSQYLALTGKATLEPRAGIKWNLDEKNALSLGYGNHSQMEELRIYFASVTDKNGASSQPNKNLTFSRAHHFVIGYDRKLGDNLRVKIEPYFQYLYNIPIIEDSTESLINFAQNWFIKDKYINKGTGKNYGIDITLERFLSHNMYFLVTGSVFEAKFGGTSGSSYNSRFNRNYVANVLFGKEFYVGHEKQNIIGINARISYRGGDRSYYINHAQSLAAKEIIYDYSRPFERRLPDLLGSDITLTYRKNKKHYSSEWALQVKNAFGSLDNYSDYYNLQTHQVVEQEGMKITVPSISYKIEF